MAVLPSFSVSRLNPANRILLGSSLLLVGVSFLTWQRFCSVKIAGGTLEGCAFNAWHGTGRLVGTLMGVGAILLIVWSVAEATSVTESFGDLGQAIGAVLVGATVGFGVLKFVVVLLHHGTLFAWLGLILLVALAYGGYMRMQEPEPSTSSSPPPAVDDGFGGFGP